MSFVLVQLQLCIKLVAAVCNLKTVIAVNNLLVAGVRPLTEDEQLLS